MKDHQDSKRVLKDITSIKQLLSSYLVSKAITEIREERIAELKKQTLDYIPKLSTNDERANKLYYNFLEMVNFTPAFVFLSKIGIEDIFNYNFESDPSVVTQAAKDTAHLQEIFGTTYATLATIDLKEHTLNVFENAIEIGKKRGRIMQTAVPVLACLFHDFGKSSKLREELLGDEIGKGYRSHASVSEMYIREILLAKYTKISGEENVETIDSIAHIVKNHHPSNTRIKSDTSISLVISADTMARKIEMVKAKRALQES